MDDQVRRLLEQLLRDIDTCRQGGMPTGAALSLMAQRIKNFLALNPKKEPTRAS